MTSNDPVFLMCYFPSPPLVQLPSQLARCQKKLAWHRTARCTLMGSSHTVLSLHHLSKDDRYVMLHVFHLGLTEQPNTSLCGSGTHPTTSFPRCPGHLVVPNRHVNGPRTPRCTAPTLVTRKQQYGQPCSLKVDPRGRSGRCVSDIRSPTHTLPFQGKKRRKK